MEKILRLEHVSTEQVQALISSLTPAGKMVSGLMEVDVSRGRGVLSEDEDNIKHCLWTEQGHRVTVSVGEYGVMVSKSKEIDPDAPEKIEQYEDDPIFIPFLPFSEKIFCEMLR